MRIAVATSGRFHVLDLARELHALGHAVRFYSYVPRRRAEKFGLPRSCQRGLLAYVFPLVYLANRGPLFLRRAASRWLAAVTDRLIAWKLEPCEVFIGMSGFCVASAAAARRQYQAKIFIERGSAHILRQKEILDRIKKMGARIEAVAQDDVRRELLTYDAADVIVVLSRFAEASFQPYPQYRGKVWRQLLGVDLTQFPPTAAPAAALPRVLFVGAWSHRKGCDILGAVLGRLQNVQLIHVGSRGDAPFPESDRFIHHDSVNQWELKNFYAQAHVLVLPSREDGMGMVLSQALACGLSIVASDQTGGPDLAEVVQDDRWVRIVPAEDSEALYDAINRALADATQRTGLRTLPPAVRERLSWPSCGQRYERKLLEVNQAG